MLRIVRLISCHKDNNSTSTFHSENNSPTTTCPHIRPGQDEPLLNRNITVLFWNVHSLEQKLLQQDLKKFVSEYDIICLSETWYTDHTPRENYMIPGYYNKMFNRKVKKLSGRKSGGLLLYYRQNLEHQIKITSNSSEYIDFKVDDARFIFMYAAPQDSVQLLQAEDPINRLMTLLNASQKYDKTYIFGDLNGRTGELVDNVKANVNLTPSRINNDKVINERGRKIIDLCHATGFVIANGRLGNVTETCDFTFRSRQGKSVNDYLLVPKHQQSSVTHFSLHQRIESDHMPLSFGVNCRHTRKEVVKNPDKLTSSTRYVWKEEKRQEYTCKLSEKLNSLDSTHKDVDEIVADLKDAILSSAANMKKKSRGEDTRQSTSPWFDTECRQMKAATVSAFKIYLRKQTADNDNIYQRNKRNYKTLLKKKKRAHQKEKVRQLIHDKKKNPKKFWQELKWKEKSKEIGASQAELENHFRAVFSDKMNSENSQWVTYVRLFNEWWLANSNKTDEYLDEEINKF